MYESESVIDPRIATTMSEQFAAVEAAYGDRAALLSADEGNDWLTFGEVGSLSRSACALLADNGANPGDRIVLALPNGTVLRIVERGVVGSGLVRVALSPRLHAREIADIAVDCGARIVCTTPTARDAVATALADLCSDAVVIGCDDRPQSGVLSPESLRECPTSSMDWPAPRPDDIAMLMYSSGTTGRPKGAVVTHRAWVAQTRRALDQLPPIGPDDVALAVAPMTHFGGSIGLDSAVCGAATVTMARFDSDAVLDAIETFGITVLPLAPVLLESLARSAHDAGITPAGIRTVPYGGSAIRADAAVMAREVFAGSLVQFYGLAEALAPLTVLTPEDHASMADDRLRSAGRVCGGVALRIVDGEVVVRSDTVMPGYWNRPQLTADVLRDGWFHTGDLGVIDPDGYLRLLGRSTDMIVTGGFNVHPTEVERVIEELDVIRDVAVVGVPHPVWGEGITAAVVLEPHARGVDRRQLGEYIAGACADHIAAYKKPVAVHIVDALPRNPAGKLDRNELRCRLSPRDKD